MLSKSLNISKRKLTLLFCIGFVLFIYSCKKENGKNEYDLVFNYDSGESKNYLCVIYEKNKKYETGYGDLVNMKDVKDRIIIQSVKGESSYLKLNLKKQEDQSLYLNWVTTTWFYMGTKTINGPLEMHGKYEKKGKTFTVDQGTFSIYWENAADYGEQPQLLTGTWTLRKQ